MNAPRTVSIVGGGLAGLTLGIALRRRGVPASVWEAGRYPRHRVCGEFFCGRGRKTLVALGLHELLAQAGAREATTASLFAGRTAGPVRPLPEAALCLSRFTLDATLASQFRTLGGELHEGMRWRDSLQQDGVVQATGRHPRAKPDGWRWFGLKAHVRNVELTADLEMHLAPGGYIGLCRLADGIVNVCGLFRRSGDADALVSRTEMLRGKPGSRLHQRLTHAEFLSESVCAIGGLDLQPRCGRGTAECRIGDALTMIPPFTGNGMSMSIETAALSVAPLEQWSRGKIPWAEAHAVIAARCEAAFRQRLAWANRLHALMFIAPLQPVLAAWLPRSMWTWNFLFAHTR